MSLQTQVKDNKATLKCQCPFLVPGRGQPDPSASHAVQHTHAPSLASSWAQRFTRNRNKSNVSLCMMISY